jgi:hypothetical protein
MLPVRFIRDLPFGWATGVLTEEWGVVDLEMYGYQQDYLRKKYLQLTP